MNQDVLKDDDFVNSLLKARFAILLLGMFIGIYFVAKYVVSPTQKRRALKTRKPTNRGSRRDAVCFDTAIFVQLLVGGQGEVR
jgi:hypothetical protein